MSFFQLRGIIFYFHVSHMKLTWDYNIHIFSTLFISNLYTKHSEYTKVNFLRPNVYRIGLIKIGLMYIGLFASQDTCSVLLFDDNTIKMARKPGIETEGKSGRVHRER